MAGIRGCMCVILCLINLKHCLGLYADQVGLFDWRQSYIGKVKFSFFDVSTHSSKRLFVGTESNVIAALNSRTGGILWRQVLEESEVVLDTLLYRENVLVSSSSAGKFVRSWDTSNGALLWEAIGNSASSPSKKVTNSPLHGWNGPQTALVDSKENELVVSLAFNLIKAFALQDGSEKWSVDNSEQSADYFSFQHSNGILYLVGTQNDVDIVIQKLNVENGQMKGERRIGAPWVNNGASCVFVKKSSLVCAETFSNSIHIISLTDESAAPVKTISLVSLGLGVEELSLGKPSLHSFGSYSNSWDERSEFLLKLSRTHQLVLNLNSDYSITVVTKFTEQSVIRAAVLGNRAILVSIMPTTDESLELKCYDLDNKRDLPDMTQKAVLVDHGEPEDAVVYLFTKKENELGYRVFLATTDHSVSLVQFPGRIMWSREEALAEVTAVEVVELPFSPSQANFETLQEEFGAHPNGRVVVGSGSHATTSYPESLFPLTSGQQTSNLGKHCFEDQKYQTSV